MRVRGQTVKTITRLRSDSQRRRAKPKRFWKFFSPRGAGGDKCRLISLCPMNSLKL